MKPEKRRKEKPKKYTTIIIIGVVLAIVVGIPWGFLEYQSAKTGKTYSQIFDKFLSTENEGVDAGDTAKGEKIDFLIPTPIGDDFESPPLISHIQAVDLDQDGLLDIVVCDALNNKVTWIRQYPLGEYNEHLCADNLVAESHVQAIDFDYDGDLDLMVSVLGMLFPNNDKIGSLVVLENDGKMNFTRHDITNTPSHILTLDAYFEKIKLLRMSNQTDEGIKESENVLKKFPNETKILIVLRSHFQKITILTRHLIKSTTFNGYDETLRDEYFRIN